MSTHRLITVFAFLIFAGCTALPAGSGAASPASPASSRTYITQEEVRAASASTALDAVRALRPAWLVKRGPQSVSFEADIVVYFGRARMGGVQALSEIAAGTITSLEFLDPAAANYRFGAGHPYGAIIVSTMEPGRD